MFCCILYIFPLNLCKIYIDIKKKNNNKKSSIYTDFLTLVYVYIYIDVLALAAAINELSSHTRRARTAMWCALQMAAQDVPLACVRSAEAATQSADFSPYTLGMYSGLGYLMKKTDQEQMQVDLSEKSEITADSRQANNDLIEKGDNNNNDTIKE